MLIRLFKSHPHHGNCLGKVSNALLAKFVGQFFMFFLFELSAALKTVDYSVLETPSFLCFGETKLFQIVSWLSEGWPFLTGTTSLWCASHTCFLSVPETCQVCSSLFSAFVTWRFLLIIQLKYHYLISLCKSPPYLISCCIFFHSWVSILNPYLFVNSFTVFLLPKTEFLRANSLSVAT